MLFGAFRVILTSFILFMGAQFAAAQVSSVVPLLETIPPLVPGRVTFLVPTTADFTPVSLVANEVETADRTGDVGRWAFDFGTPGKRSVQAVGISPTQQMVVSRTVEIDVQIPAGTLTSFKGDVSTMTLNGPGDSDYMELMAQLQGSQARLNVSTASEIQFTTGNPNVASVRQDGLIIAEGAGETQIVARLRGRVWQVSVRVKDGRTGDLDYDDDVDTDDLNLLLLDINTPVVSRRTAKDLNGDGVVTILDSRVLVQLCSRARCATN